MKISYAIVTILYLLLASMNARAVGRRLFTPNENLSSSLIVDVYIDSRNEVWIATENGLNRYDGSKITSYHSNAADSTSLSHNYVKNVFEDSKGRIFVSTFHGIQQYNPLSDSFYPLVKKMGELTHVSSGISSVVEFPGGEILVGGNELCRLKEAEGGGLFLERVDIAGLPPDKIDAMVIDAGGNLWIARQNDGVYRLDKQHRVTRFPATDSVSGIQVLAVDKEGNVFGGSPTRGVFRFNPERNAFENLIRGQAAEVPLKVSALYSVGLYQLYIGTDGDGLKMYDSRTGKITDVILDTNIISLNDAKVHSIVRDNYYNLWVGVFQKGVLMVPNQTNPFHYVGSRSSVNNVIGDKSVTAFCHDSDSRNLWVGTDGDGVYMLGHDDKTVAHYGQRSGVPAIISTLFYNPDDRMVWVGSYGDGGAWLNPMSGVATPMNIHTADGSPVANIYDFERTPDGKIRIATMGNGLFVFDPATRSIGFDRELGPHVNSDWICCLYYSSHHNKLFVGTYSGLFEVDMAEKPSPRRHLLQSQIIYCIYEDGKGLLWIGTPDGLVKLDPATGQSSTFTTESGLSSNTIYSILADNVETLWLGTAHGLTRFYKESGHTVNYYFSDGIQSNEFMRNAALLDPNGLMLFGGIGGITFFYPTEILAPSKKWTVKLSGMYINNEQVSPGTMSEGIRVTESPVAESTHFNLHWNANSFTLEFATTDPAAPERLIYQYRLDGGEWIALPAGQNMLSVSNLAPGHHTIDFKVKDYTIESDPKTINISVAIPWYRSMLAKVIYVIMLIGLLWLARYLFKRNYRIRQEVQRHKQLEELNEAKLVFLINIAHEIRTPLSLIISPLQKLLQLGDDEEHTRCYNTMMRNANRMLRLVNELLDLRKIEKGKLRIECCETDIVKFIANSISNFDQLAELKDISINFVHKGFDELRVWIDPIHFEKVIDNLLSNAIKYTPKGGSVTVLVEAVGNEMIIKVCDTGIGIPQDQLENIFSRFYQISAPDRRSILGSGVGLHLVRSLVTLHHGTVYATQGEDAKGACFIIRLPLGNAHLSADEISSAGKVAADSGEGLQLQYPRTVPEPVAKMRPHTAYRILVVEDDEEIRSYLEAELCNEYYVATAADGKEGLEAIQKKAPDLVISDIMMPEIDGLELCRRIKQNIRLNSIPVILLTAKTGEASNIEGLECGADAYVTKPFNINVLRQMIDNIIRTRKVLKNAYSGSQEAPADKLDKIEAQSPDERLMARIMKSVNAHLSDPELTVETIASEVGLSRSHLHRKLKELTNQTTRDFIRNLRLQQAAKLLREKKHSISEVADITGFANLGNFSTAFKALYGKTPTEFRGKHPN